MSDVLPAAVAPPADRPSERAALGSTALLAVFTASVFTSAFLLFLVQPLFGRMALPRLGGSPAVWNACMLFFQAALLAGYLYAHLASRALGLRGQTLLHLALMAAAALVLPIALGSRVPDAGTAPVLWLMGAMAATVGPPFAVLAGTGPLLQRWFAHSGHPYAADPYPLYAASNLGSTLALFAYPALVEPRFRLAEQSLGWALGYGLLAALILGCGLLLRPRSAAPVAVAADAGAAPVSALERVRWVAFAFVPSSMLLAVTAYLTTDLVPIPLLWVLPLGLYLLSFTLVFARRPLIPHGWMVAAQPSLLVVTGVMLLEGLVRRPTLAVSLHLLGLFVTAMVCHGELARRRPHVRHLTEFYLWIAVGGVLGGVFNVLVAPVVFNRLWEYPLIVVAAALARPWPPRATGRRAYLVPGLSAVVVSTALQWATAQEEGISTVATLAVAAIAVNVAAIGLGRSPGWLAIALATVLGVRTVYDMSREGTLLATRSFFGTYRVARIEAGSGNYHTLTHGSTLHGAQSLDASRRRDPLTYYLRNGPLGQVFASLGAPVAHRRVAFVGLGTGTAAAYGSGGDRWTFYEIDPGIERIARDTALFTYLADSPAELRVVLGDARLRLAEAPPASYDLIALDAFTSDAVPTHLLTLEALDMYLEKLAPGGLIAYHVSNRYLDLESVTAALARERGLAAWVGNGPYRRPTRYDQFSTWVVLARDSSDLGPLVGDSRWEKLRPQKVVRPWTDDYSSVLSVMDW